MAIGGRLSPDWLLDAYTHGIFPWPFESGQPVAWWSPDPRAVLEFDSLHVARRLARTIRAGQFRVSADQAFRGVIVGCATAGDRHDNTWLTQEMIDAYVRLHELGHAHSIEVWQGDRLVGGTYGVSIGAFFAAESMFHLASNASKVALVALVAHLRARGFTLLDIQQWTPHTGRFGAVEIPRIEYLRRLAIASHAPVAFGPPVPDLRGESARFLALHLRVAAGAD